MSDMQNEVQFLTEELSKAKQRLTASEQHYQTLAVMCASYHALLFGDACIPPKDPSLVMRTIAYSSAHAMLNQGAKNFVSWDFVLSDLPKHPEPFQLNITVQRVEGKSPAQLLEEQKRAMEAMIMAITMLSPELAETITLSHPWEIPGVVADWFKTHAIACPADSTAYTQSHK